MHHYLIGRSRNGKSTYLEHLIASSPGGWIFIDPHGHSAERVADTHACIYWDVGEAIVGFNPLSDIPKGQRPLVATQVVYALKAVAGAASWGPRLNWILYNAVRLALDANGTLLDIPRILTDKDYRLRRLRHASYRDFWEREFEEWDDRFRNEAIAPVLNKLGMFAADPVLRATLTHSTLSLKKVLVKGQRLVVNLAKGKIGEEPAHLLGALIVSTLYSAAQSRPPGSPEFEIFADEFQNFATQSFADILSEAGKYGLNLVLAHQYLDQLPQELLPAVFANVSHVTAFRVSAEDANRVSREMDLLPDHLLDLAPFEAWVKNGRRRKVKTPPPLDSLGLLARNRRTTEARYARMERTGG